MNRRRFLAAVTATAMAGCVGGDGSPTATGQTADGGTPAGTPTGSTAGDPGDLPVDPSTLDRPVPKDAIPAITDPVFGADWSGIEMTVSGTYGQRRIEPRLSADDEVIGVSRDGVARAYPLRVLDWHEVVNDTFPAGSEGTTDGDAPLLVTYCPLCATGVVARRTVDGEATRFGVSGYLYRSGLVLYDDATGSLWSQVRALGIHGPETGTRLDLLAATMTTLGEWRDAHPDTEVLRPPPESNTVNGAVTRDYTRNPYARYEDRDAAGLGNREFEDDRLHPKARVLGVVNGGVARAYAFETVREAGAVNDSVAGLPVVVAASADGTLAAYVRRVDGERVTFEAAGDGFLRAGGSRWRVSTGEAVDGPHEGARLERATRRSPTYWFSWLERHPDTELYGSQKPSASRIG